MDKIHPKTASVAITVLSEAFLRASKNITADQNYKRSLNMLRNNAEQIVSSFKKATKGKMNDILEYLGNYIHTEVSVKEVLLAFCELQERINGCKIDIQPFSDILRRHQSMVTSAQPFLAYLANNSIKIDPNATEELIDFLLLESNIIDIKIDTKQTEQDALDIINACEPSMKNIVYFQEITNLKFLTTNFFDKLKKEIKAKNLNVEWKATNENYRKHLKLFL